MKKKGKAAMAALHPPFTGMMPGGKTHRGGKKRKDMPQGRQPKERGY